MTRIHIGSLTTALIGSPAPGYLVRFLESKQVMDEVNRLYSLFRGSIPAVDANLPEPLVRAAEPWPITGSAVRRTCSAWHSAEGHKHNRGITKVHEKEMRDGTQMGMGECL